jgi:hypothetical protein
MASVAYKQRIRLLIELTIFAGGDRTRALPPGHLSDLFRIHNIANISEVAAHDGSIRSFYCSLTSITRTRVKQFWTEQQPQSCLSYKGVDRHNPTDLHVMSIPLFEERHGAAQGHFVSPSTCLSKPNQETTNRPIQEKSLGGQI